jgi:acetate kinase
VNVLVLNAGSSSVKYAVIDADSAQPPRRKDRAHRRGVTHEQAFAQILERCSGISDRGGRPSRRARRRTFTRRRHRRRVEAAIEPCAARAAAQPANLAGIRAARKSLGAFRTSRSSTRHSMRACRAVPAPTRSTRRRRARRHPALRLPRHFARVRRGLAAKALGRNLAELRMITLHLGNGASAVARSRGFFGDTRPRRAWA